MTKGATACQHLSDHLRNIILQNVDVKFLVVSCAELSLVSLIHCMYEMHSRGLLSNVHIRSISEKTNLSVLELVLEALFYPDQTKDVFPQLNKLKDSMM